MVAWWYYTELAMSVVERSSFCPNHRHVITTVRVNSFPPRFPFRVTSNAMNSHKDIGTRVRAIRVRLLLDVRRSICIEQCNRATARSLLSL